MESSGAEDGHARSDEVQGAEAADELAEDPKGTPELRKSGARAFKKVLCFRRRGCFTPPELAAEGNTSGEKRSILF